MASIRVISADRSPPPRLEFKYWPLNSVVNKVSSAAILGRLQRLMERLAGRFSKIRPSAKNSGCWLLYSYQPSYWRLNPE